MRGEIGAGGMGTVYRVFDRGRGSDVALKVLRHRSGLDLYRFKREFRALADLRHPNLVTLHELFAVDGEWMFTMELVEGVPFHAWVRPPDGRGALDEDRLRDALGQIGDALAALHDAGKIHRDIKPSNLLVEPDGRVVLLDFGLVTGTDELLATPTHEGIALGTPAYMSPEQACDEPLTTASDLYSLGVMLYEALTGRRTHAGSRVQIMERKQLEDPLSPSALAPVPADLDDLCMQLLERAPADRPDAAAVLAVLGRDATPATHADRPVVAADPAALAVLHAALVASRERPVLVVVSGPTGSGKTELLEAFRAELAGGDALVLSGRAARREELAYRAGDQMIDQLSAWLVGLPAEVLASLLPANLAALAREFPVLQRLPAGHAPVLPGARTLAPAELRREAGVAMTELAVRISAGRPLAFLIDDGQWGTAAGMELASRLAAARCLVVVAIASDEDATLVQQFVDGWRGERRRVELAP